MRVAGVGRHGPEVSTAQLEESQVQKHLGQLPAILERRTCQRNPAAGQGVQHPALKMASKEACACVCVCACLRLNRGSTPGLVPVQSDTIGGKFLPDLGV